MFSIFQNHKVIQSYPDVMENWNEERVGASFEDFHEEDDSLGFEFDWNRSVGGRLDYCVIEQLMAVATGDFDY